MLEGQLEKKSATKCALVKEPVHAACECSVEKMKRGDSA